MNARARPPTADSKSAASFTLAMASRALPAASRQLRLNTRRLDEHDGAPKVDSGSAERPRRLKVAANALSEALDSAQPTTSTSGEGAADGEAPAKRSFFFSRPRVGRTLAEARGRTAPGQGSAPRGGQRARAIAAGGDSSSGSPPSRTVGSRGGPSRGGGAGRAMPRRMELATSGGKQQAVSDARMPLKMPTGSNTIFRTFDERMRPSYMPPFTAFDISSPALGEVRDLRWRPSGSLSAGNQAQLDRRQREIAGDYSRELQIGTHV